MAIKVYRIEDLTGDGMYNGTATDINSSYHDHMRHPMPNSDSLLVQNASKHSERDLDGGSIFGGPELYDYLSEFRYGFISKEQLRNWLYNDDWLVRLSEKFILTIYELPDDAVIVGNTQACFLRDKFISQECHNIKEYFNLV